jgi:hypothetical protein
MVPVRRVWIAESGAEIMINRRFGSVMKNKLGPIYLGARLTLIACVCVIHLFTGKELAAQSISLDSLTTRFNSFAGKNLQEKIYLHTDKDLYLPGEILWFKAYQTGAAANTLIDFSKIVYTEILDKDNQSVMQAKNAIIQGSANGSLHLPPELATGTYRIRSYTNWMKNFSPDYFFEKPLYIVNTLAKPAVAATQNISNYDVQFFPEGGELVAGLVSKIGFRATDDQGKGIAFSGLLIDDNNDTISTFQPVHVGIGHFIFKPSAGKVYRAVIRVPGRAQFSVPLPQVRDKGYVLSVREVATDRLDLSIASTGPASEQMLLLVHTRQETKIAEMIELLGGNVKVDIDKSRLGEGISHITLFNSAGKPVCERLYFKRPGGLDFIVKSDQESYGRRRKVSLSFEARNEKGELSDANASVSVYSDDGLKPGIDIVSYLWLKSELRGNIEDPGFYFLNAGPQADAALDNLMLTQGWRRFVWDDILNRKIAPVAFLPELQGHIITGKLTDVRSNAPVGGVLAYLSVPGKNFQLYTSRSDNAGRLTFYARNISGPSELVAQTNFRQDSIYQIEMSSPFSTSYASSLLPALSLGEGLRSGLLKQSLGNQVQNVYLGNKLRTFYPAATDSGSFYLDPSKSYVLDNFVRFNTMEEVLKEYVTEVPVTRQREEFNIWVAFKRHYNDSYRNVEPLLVFDGIPIFDRGTKMVRYDPKKVKTVEILDRKYYHGLATFNSIIHFKSYRSNLPDFQLDRRASVMDYEGTQLRREFYAPVYETASQSAERMPDFRNLLYWSPDVKIGPSGKTELTFHTSDQTGKYVVVLQGISSTGRVGNAGLTLVVR